MARSNFERREPLLWSSTKTLPCSSQSGLVVEGRERAAGLHVGRVELGHLLVGRLGLVDAVELLVQAGHRVEVLGVVRVVLDDLLRVAQGLLEVLERRVGVDGRERPERVQAQLLALGRVGLVDLERLLVVLDRGVEVRAVLVALLAGSVQVLVRAREVELRLGEVGLEGDRLLVVLDRLAIVLFLVAGVAVLERRLRLDEVASHAGEDERQRGRRARACDIGFSWPSPGESH